jgi:hypothetical protein
MRVFLVGAFCASLVLGSSAACRAQTLAQQYGVVLRSFNATLTPPAAADIAQHVLLLASYYSLDPRLLVAVVGVESGWDAHAISPAGAQGLGQLMPSTADHLSVQAFEKYENLDGTARYIRRFLNQYANRPVQQRYSLAIASYNAGPEAVRRYGGVPPFAQTQSYVQHVLRLWHQLKVMLPSATRAVAAHVAPARSATSAQLASTKHLTPFVVDTVESAPAPSNSELGSREARDLEAETATPPAQKKTIGRWFARVLGVH